VSTVEDDEFDMPTEDDEVVDDLEFPPATNESLVSVPHLLSTALALTLPSLLYRLVSRRRQPPPPPPQVPS
jgi:hypothetical protein